MPWLYFNKQDTNDMIDVYLFYPGYMNVCEGFITYSNEYVINKIAEKQNISGRYHYIGLFTDLLTLLDILEPNELIWLHEKVDYQKLLFLADVDE